MMNSKEKIQKDIDVVIAWVDGNDPKHKAKLNSYLQNKTQDKLHGANPTRFNSVNEIKYCVLSILKFAPFVRNIFIVTDNQDPNIDNDVKSLFPERFDSIRIVDHKEIFRGHEEFLPTFNSISIGAFVWRIEGLAENFVYFNDDIFLIRNINKEDWFINENPVIRGTWKVAPIVRYYFKKYISVIKLILNKELEPNIKPSFYINQWLGASQLGYRYKYFRTGHTAHAMHRGKIEKFFNQNKEVFLKNVSHRFRKFEQFNIVSLVNHIELKNKTKINKKPNGVTLMPINRSKKYVDRKIEYCTKNDDIKYLCAQSLDQASIEDRNKILGWMEKILNT